MAKLKLKIELDIEEDCASDFQAEFENFVLDFYQESVENVKIDRE